MCGGGNWEGSIHSQKRKKRNKIVVTNQTLRRLILKTTEQEMVTAKHWNDMPVGGWGGQGSDVSCNSLLMSVFAGPQHEISGNRKEELNAGICGPNVVGVFIIL